jgi:DNA repair protein RecO (recombination protein O)
MPLSLSALKVLRYLQTRPWDSVKILQISTPLHMEIERLTLAYITYLLERRLQSVEFLRRLRREES